MWGIYYFFQLFVIWKLIFHGVGYGWPGFPSSSSQSIAMVIYFQHKAAHPFLIFLFVLLFRSWDGNLFESWNLRVEIVWSPIDRLWNEFCKRKKEEDLKRRKSIKKISNQNNNKKRHNNEWFRMREKRKKNLNERLGNRAKSWTFHALHRSNRQHLSHPLQPCKQKGWLLPVTWPRIPTQPTKRRSIKREGGGSCYVVRCAKFVFFFRSSAD